MSEPVFVTRTACGVRLKASAEMAGKTTPCPKCQEPLHVPHPTAEPERPSQAASATAVARALTEVDAARD